MPEADFVAMQQSVVEGAPERARELARQALESGAAAAAVLEQGFLAGIREVGAQYAQGKMFLPDMMAAAEAMKAAVGVLDVAFHAAGEDRPAAGTVVLGTTKGDIHEIGKALVGTLLSANGFRVHDLGVDVATEVFAEKARELGADIVGVSALLTTTMQGQRKVVEALERAGLRPRVKVMVGGAPVTRRWAEEIGADGFGKDAFSSVTLARTLLNGHAAVMAGGK
jgi:corrinoid protein of di/trimethylamine methyltransferase